VRGVSKLYRIYERPQDRLKQALFGRFGRVYGHDFWALRDVSFELERGEALGILGQNGAGKSTLLQIIAGTLAPTAGETRVVGRVAALLELGSGFNPEFTGRENVFLNGAVLGIGRAEIETKLDRIFAFADIGEFVDQPVKLYSSGMMMRLAFAVQAHVEPDVLIVDEALSVGDIRFQHKCMRHINQLIERGTTLLFVSHSTETVKRFCRRGLWLNGGQVRYFGDAGVAAQKYLGAMWMSGASDWDPLPGEEDLLEGPSASEADSLPRAWREMLTTVTADVDLADERLFLRGSWDWAIRPGAPTQARRSADPAALAGFRWYGSRIALTFLRGPEIGSVEVSIDGTPHRLNLFHPTERRPETVWFDVERGEHVVLIAPTKSSSGRRAGLCWFGGRVDAPAELAFHIDPELDSHRSEVERYGTGQGRLTAVELLDWASEQPVTELAFGQRVRLRLHAERLGPTLPRLELSWVVRDRNRIDLFGTTSADERICLDRHAERYVVEFAFDVRLGPGSYSILAAFTECSEDLTHRVPLDQIDIARVFTASFDPLRPVWYAFHEPVAIQATVFRELPDGTSGESLNTTHSDHA
jgi:ABC-type polysaccharide/polyol phosphate transport system ATPase subunit